LVFFQFHLLHWVDYELDFMIYFGLFSMRLSPFYDLDHMFCRLTRVDWGSFIVFFLGWFFFLQFQHSTIGLLKIDLHNLFWLTSYDLGYFLFTFYKVILSSWRSWVWQFNSGQFFLLFFIFVLILSFNIWLIWNQASNFFWSCFL
jgi:hypothetical protein